MLKLLKNLKKTWISVVFIVILLCVQAWADLTLPAYTSKIVNTGIQAGGIEHVSPEVIRASTMENLLMLVTNKEEILQYYTKRSNTGVESNQNNVKQYPILKTEDIYQLKDITKEQRNELDAIIAKPLMIASMLTQEETEEALKAQILENVTQEQKMAMANRNLIEILKNMPKEEVTRLVESLNQAIDENVGTMVEQASISVVKEEYKAIGIDTDAIQNRYIIKIGLQMLVIALISMISAISIMFLSSRVAAFLGKTLRDKVFKKVLGFSRRRIYEFFDCILNYP